MKASDIWKGQTYLTDMPNRFISENKTLSPIKILAHEAGFIIFQRDAEKQAIKAKDFISIYITACKYRLKRRSAYVLSNELPLRLIKQK